MINKREEMFLLRRRKKITLTSLAKQMNCSQSLLSRFESGDCNISEEKLQKYIEIINSKI